VGGGNWFVQSVWQQIALALPKIDFGNEHKLLFFLCIGRDSGLWIRSQSQNQRRSCWVWQHMLTNEAIALWGWFCQPINPSNSSSTLTPGMSFNMLRNSVLNSLLLFAKVISSHLAVASEFWVTNNCPMSCRHWNRNRNRLERETSSLFKHLFSNLS